MTGLTNGFILQLTVIYRFIRKQLRHQNKKKQLHNGHTHKPRHVQPYSSTRMHTVLW